MKVWCDAQVIGATSSLTYNVVGHIKTVIILTGGCVFFGDEMPLKKFLGIATAMLGIVWYSQARGPHPPAVAVPAQQGRRARRRSCCSSLRRLPQRSCHLFLPRQGRAERLAAPCMLGA